MIWVILSLLLVIALVFFIITTIITHAKHGRGRPSFRDLRIREMAKLIHKPLFIIALIIFVLIILLAIGIITKKI